MPPLTWHPEFERHATLGALAHCPASYYWTRQVAEGAIPAEPTSEAAAIGLVFDAGATAFHCQTPFLPQHAEGWDILSEVQRQLVLDGVQQYAAQWIGVHPWTVLAAHPYEDDAQRPRWVLFHRYLAMPDLVVALPDGAVLTVDIKTSKYPFDLRKWAFDMQLITQALAARRAYPEAPRVGSLIAYAKLPNKSDAGQWTFPATVPLWLTAEREATAEVWVIQQLRKSGAINAVLADHRGLLLGWREAPYACMTPYGPCRWRGRCWGEET